MAGTYTVTEGSANTGVPVTVTDRDTSVTLDYYTVTYYDREPGDSAAQPYGTNTAWRPQIVLKGGNISRAATPGRNRYHFDGWVNDKGETFDFPAKIEKKTDIYATWSTNVTVSIKVRKDTDPWEDHGKSFMLLPEGGTELIKPSDVESEGTYVVYDVTGLEDVTSPREDRNTGVSVEVSAEEAATYGTVKEAVVDYYTVTFHDDYPDGRIYGDDTDQARQTVLKGKKAEKPETPPSKAGYRFIGWMTAKGGGTEFDFDQPVENRTDIFALFRANEKNSSSEEISENAPGGGGDIQMTTVSQEAESLPQAQTDGEPDADGKEPKTGDTAHVEIYATAAMIAGLTYLLLYFMEEGRGMTEREKEVFVAAFIRWAKKGGRFRKCCAIAAIFCLLVYYHGIGKRMGKGSFDRECLRQAL